MPQKRKEHPKVKLSLHPRNKHRARYDFKELIKSCPELSPYVALNKYKDESIDFSNPKAVMMLNKSLLMHFYGIDNWNIPTGYLCPPIPGRADYIHHIADLLSDCNNGIIPQGDQINCLDIGVGANCIYPIIGCKEYGWSFVGSDIDPTAIHSASEIIESNNYLKGKVVLRLQKNASDIFRGVISNEYFDLTICNPPFHDSASAAQSANLRRLKNLNRKQITKPVLNFGGQNNELWCKGGEEQFVSTMILESREYSTSCFWFSTLISKKSLLNNVYKALNKSKATEVKTIPMGQGNKISRIVAWTYLNRDQQEKWIKTRWKQF